jgi:hypothetical protein
MRWVAGTSLPSTNLMGGSEKFFGLKIAVQGPFDFRIGGVGEASATGLNL